MPDTELQEAQQKTKRLSVIDAASIMQCSVQTVYNRAKKYGWEQGKDPGSSAWVEVPTEWLKKTSFNEETEVETPTLPTNELVDKVLEKLEDTYKELVASKEKEIKAQQAQIEALNNQIAAQNNQLVVLKEKNSLKSQAELRAEVEAEVKAEYESQKKEQAKPRSFFEKLKYAFSNENPE